MNHNLIVTWHTQVISSQHAAMSFLKMIKVHIGISSWHSRKRLFIYLFLFDKVLYKRCKLKKKSKNSV
jgi:hypothetical protein